MQATVQDREGQCAEGDPSGIKEWCSEEGIHRCLSNTSKVLKAIDDEILVSVFLFHLC